jgi:hypothetical protein
MYTHTYSAPSAGVAAKAAVTSGDSVSFTVEEKLLVKMNKDGAMESLEVRGELKMCVNSPESAFPRVQVCVCVCV